MTKDEERMKGLTAKDDESTIHHSPFINLVQKYIGLTKPERTMANVITAAAGFLLASTAHIDFRLFLSTIVGLSLLVASACALNNVIDAELDAKMPRTKKRALVTGNISKTSGLIFAIILGVAGIVILWFYVSMLVTLLGAIAYFDYIVLYGYTKRKSEYGTLVGTVCGSIPMVAGYSAVAGRVDASAIILYLSMTFWQMAHFYSIAIYRLKDYMAGNIPVWPAKYGVRNTKIQIMLFIIAFTASSLALCYIGQTGVVYFAVMLLASLYWFRQGLNGWSKLNDTKWARKMFGVSLNVLLVFAAAVAFGARLP